MLALVLCLAIAGIPGPEQPGRGKFIVAFELRAGGPEFVWPVDSFPPARHAAVLLVVEDMPRVRIEGSTEVRKLSAPHHLHINGRLQTPRRPDGARRSRAAIDDEFVVALREGRLRLSVALPAGSRVDAQHRTARVALYEIDQATSRPR